MGTLSALFEAKNPDSTQYRSRDRAVKWRDFSWYYLVVKMGILQLPITRVMKSSFLEFLDLKRLE